MSENKLATSVSSDSAEWCFPLVLNRIMASDIAFLKRVFSSCNLRIIFNASTSMVNLN
ncbi:MAG: hypothetical protein LBC68_13485 [Prevotellaceae bacterium]|nr:hypothetical protein [Prevotellaceae bacterium]